VSLSLGLSNGVILALARMFALRTSGQHRAAGRRRSFSAVVMLAIVAMWPVQSLLERAASVDPIVIFRSE
jgi:hypothetical protein